MIFSSITSYSMLHSALSSLSTPPWSASKRTFTLPLKLYLGAGRRAGGEEGVRAGQHATCLCALQRYLFEAQSVLCVLGLGRTVTGTQHTCIRTSPAPGCSLLTVHTCPHHAEPQRHGTSSTTRITRAGCASTHLAMASATPDTSNLASSGSFRPGGRPCGLDWL